MAVVLESDGMTVKGIITLEDVVEEIIGVRFFLFSRFSPSIFSNLRPLAERNPRRN